MKKIPPSLACFVSLILHAVTEHSRPVKWKVSKQDSLCGGCCTERHYPWLSVFLSDEFLIDFLLLDERMYTADNWILEDSSCSRSISVHSSFLTSSIRTVINSHGLSKLVTPKTHDDRSHILDVVLVQNCDKLRISIRPFRLLSTCMIRSLKWQNIDIRLY